MIEIKIKPLSVNDAWKGRHFHTDEYKAFFKELWYLLPYQMKIHEGKLQVTYIFGLSNRNADWDNPIKAFQDIIAKKYHFNDNRVYRAVVEKVDVKKGEEFISFIIDKFMPKEIKCNKKEMVEEHKRIVPELKKAGLKKEATKQEKEYKELKKK